MVTPYLIPCFFIGSTILSFISFVHMFATAHATNWPMKAKLAVGMYGLLNLALRLEAMVVFFVPSLGLMDSLSHYQADRIPFFNGWDNGDPNY